MGRYVEERTEGIVSVACKRISLTALKAGTSRMAQRILQALAEQPRYSYELAKKLGVHEQKIYYHMRNLERGGLITAERHEAVSGAKYYRLTAPAFAVTLKEPRASGPLPVAAGAYADLIEPFITAGKADFLIVVGSPEAHGPRMARGKDGSFAIDLALFLGSFLAERPHGVVRLDTELKEAERYGNLIIIGGPIVNTVAGLVNDALPLRFTAGGKHIFSTLSGKTYEQDEVGIIVKAPNPLAKEKSLFFIAGVRQAGTRAAILALTTKPELIVESPVRVVRGIDGDSDGIVDTVVFLE
ncbi:ArsR family transcriptional regulator [Candidatus Woesearchaeota archaeon]|nr:MAG: ArsR family transcriptional regulator [Candidatus Woesearchaeota archaeon]